MFAAAMSKILNYIYVIWRSILGVDFLNDDTLEGADGMVPQPDVEFPERRIVVHIEYFYMAGGNLGNANNAPDWLEPNQAHSDQFEFYIRTQDHQFEGVFGPIVDHSGQPNAPLHTTLMSAHIHALRGEYYITIGPFEVLTQQLLQHLRQQPGSFPPVDYVYVTVPEGEMYRAPLKRQWYTKGEERLNSIYREAPSPKPGIISRLGDYIRRMYHSH